MSTHRSDLQLKIWQMSGIGGVKNGQIQLNRLSYIKTQMQWELAMFKYIKED